MDPRYTFRKGYDTDLIVLRSLFALDANTNLPISSFYSPVANGIGGIEWLSPELYFSSKTGILNFVSSIESFSTITGLFSNFSTQSFSNFYTRSLLTSTVSTLFVSAQSITVSSLTFFDTRGGSTTNIAYFSSGNFFVNGNIFYNPNTVLTNNLVSTVVGLGTAGYISSSQFLSTIDKLGSNGLGYVNRTQLVSTSASLLTLITNTSNQINTVGTATSNYAIGIGVATSNYAAGIGTSSSNYTVSIGNFTSNYAANIGTSNSNYSATIGTNTSNYATTIDRSTIVSTVAGLGTIGFVSTPSLVSTTIALGIPGPSFASTVAGLGTAGYISSSQLLSSIVGLGGTGLISTGQLISTVTGLGTAGYISSSQLQSTVVGLGGTGLVSTGQLISTVTGLGTAGYISSSQLLSTTAGVINLISPASGASVANLISSVAGLGSAGYVSTTGLVSTTIGLQNSFTVVNASQVFIANATRVNISTVGSLIFMSTFYESSITYQGNNGDITASNAAGATAPFYFSSATLNLDRWSTYITATSVVTLTAYPNFFFTNLGLSTNPPLIYMSSFIQGGARNFLSSQMAFSAINPTTFSNGQSNFFNQEFKITMPGSAIQSLWPAPTRLVHYMPNALTIGGTNGFVNCNMSIYFGSTNSLFLTVQNLPL